MLCEKGLIGYVKSIDTCRPAQSSRANMRRNFSLSINFLHVKGRFLIVIQSVVCQRALYEKIIG